MKSDFLIRPLILRIPPIDGSDGHQELIQWHWLLLKFLAKEALSKSANAISNIIEILIGILKASYLEREKATEIAFDEDVRED